jgi:hypothetical protein
MQQVELSNFLLISRLTFEVISKWSEERIYYHYNVTYVEVVSLACVSDVFPRLDSAYVNVLLCPISYYILFADAVLHPIPIYRGKDEKSCRWW